MKGGALSSTKKLTAKEIASLVRKSYARKSKTKSPLIQSSKYPKSRSVTKASVKGGALPNKNKLTAKKITSLVKKPSAGKPKTKSHLIQYLKHTKPKSVTKVSMKGGTLPSIKNLIAEKIASLVKKPFVEKSKTKSPSI